jgi:hypothetical protein
VAIGGNVNSSQAFATFEATLGNSLVDNTWFGPSGLTAKQMPSGSEAYTKTEYDAFNRPTVAYVAYATEGENPWTVGLGDVVFEQVATDYDAANNAIRTVAYQRNEGIGSGGGFLTEIDARVSFAGMWYDGAGRPIASANYGTTYFDRDLVPTPPERSDDVLVSSTGYNARGEAFESVDPAGMVSRVEFDDAGRTIRVIQNYKPEASGSDENVTTETRKEKVGRKRFQKRMALSGCKSFQAACLRSSRRKSFRGFCMSL